MALAILSPAFPATSADDPGSLGGPLLRIPGLPPVQLPLGIHGYRSGGDAPSIRAPRAATPDADLYHEYGTVQPGGGQRGHGGSVVPPGMRPFNDAGKRATATKKKPPTFEEKQAQIRKALTPKPPLAVVRRQTLEDLYSKLAAATDEDESKGLASLIAAIWMRSGSDTADLLMARAEKAVGDKKYPLAIQVLDRVVALQPDWAEGWNKRAAARYLNGDLDGSMADVDHVLKLEPRHFLALSGMAMILQRTGFDKRALQIYRRSLAIYPHQPEVEKIVEKLTLSVEGQGI